MTYYTGHGPGRWRSPHLYEMATLQVSPSETLYFEHTAPTAKPHSFVFVNALTGSTEQWEAAVAPGLRDLGFGTLSYNFRGQAKSSFATGKQLDEDVERVIKAVKEILS